MYSYATCQFVRIKPSSETKLPVPPRPAAPIETKASLSATVPSPRCVDLGGGHAQAHGPERLLQLLHGGDGPGAEAAEDARVQRAARAREDQGCSHLLD